MPVPKSKRDNQRRVGKRLSRPERARKLTPVPRQTVNRAKDERRRAEQRVAESERRFRTTVEVLPVGINHIDQEGRILYANPRFEQLLGYAPGSVAGRFIHEFAALEPDAVKEFLELRRQLHAGEVQRLTGEHRYRRSDGSTVWVALTVALVRDAQGKPLYDVTAVEDITDRKQAEVALRESVARFRSLTKLSSDWYWEQDRDFTFVAISGNTPRAPELMIGRKPWELEDAEPGDPEWKSHREILEAHRPFRDFTRQYFNQAGERRFISTSGEPVFDGQGEFRGYRGIGRDVTESMNREEDLLRFRAAMDLSVDSILLIDRAAMRYVDVNRTACQQYGYSREEMLRMGPQHFSMSTREQLERLYDELIAGRRGAGPRENYRRRKDGSLVPIEVYQGAVPTRNGHIIVAIVRDISERKRAEQLVRLEHAVARSLAEADKAQDALKAVIRAICESENWECGRYLRVDEQAGVLRFSEHWSKPDDALEAFIAEARGLFFGPGVGLVGKAWQSGQPLWVADLNKDPRALRTIFAAETGIRGAFVFPVISEGKTIGVLIFNSREVREQDEQLLQAVGAIGGQIGQFLRRKYAEEELRRFRAAMDASVDLVLLIDPVSTRYIDVNSAACHALGYSREEMLAMSSSDVALATQEELVRAYARLVAGDLSEAALEGWFRRKDGSRLPIEVVRRALPSAEGHVIVVVARDITRRKRAEEAMRTHALRQRLIAEFGQQALAGADFAEVLNRAVELAHDTLRVDYCEVLELEPDGRRLIYRAAAGRPIEWVGQRVVPVEPGSHVEYVLSRSEALIVEDYDAETRSRPSPLAAQGVKSGIQAPILRASGVFGILSASTLQPRRFTDEDVSFLRSIANMLAVADERKNAEERLARLAQFDTLTGLPNRALFQDRLLQAVAQARRSGRPMAVLFIDLDRFKPVNDTLGHAAGDQLLKETAARMVQCVRSGDTIGRFGGDEFGAILHELAKSADASVVAQKIMNALIQPFHIAGQEIFISASIGITLYPADGEDPEALIRNADVAMYRAKEGGRNGYRFFTLEMNERALQRAQLEISLRRALERGELVLYYQPKVELAGGVIRGFEALLRWKRSDEELIAPGEFISVLEDSGLIVPVGEWVMRETCMQLKAWRTAGLAPLPIAVNLSARQFQQKDLEATVHRTLNEAGVDPALLEFEITESLVMKDAEQAARTMRSLKDLGVGVSVDDFGTGYSSLGYLKRFPIDSLKIDRIFIRDIATDPDDATITRAMINLAHSLKLRVVAEGVETEEQLEFLRANSCDEAQGYYFSRPVPATEAEAMLREGRTLWPSGTKR